MWAPVWRQGNVRRGKKWSGILMRVFVRNVVEKRTNMTVGTINSVMMGDSDEIAWVAGNCSLSYTPTSASAV